MTEEGETLHSMAWKRWQERRRSRVELPFPAHSAASKSSKFEWKKEHLPLGSRKLLVWIRYKSGDLAINTKKHRESRALLQRQADGWSSQKRADDEILESFDARNIIAAAAAKRAATQAAGEAIMIGTALREKSVAEPPFKAKKEREATKFSAFKNVDSDSKQKPRIQKRQRTPERKSFRLATRQAIVQPKYFVDSSEEESSDSSDSD